ncbi:MAG: hypothetical protein KatS3mg129_2060 [Leptospiraceae bacterium]|nr:MAG: hypothetical protein KatS3mg129_2060 [Leptospiraceae bacterium]
MKKYVFIIVVVILFLYCKKQDEKATLSILGSGITGNYYYFEGEIDKDITPYCGECW